MILILFAAIPIINSFCHISLKIGVNRNERIFLNRYTIAGYLGLFLVTILTIYVLRDVELKSVTVLLSLNYVITLTLSRIFLKEAITSRKWIGTTLIFCGVIFFYL
jgi:drug/metabolite transporter (DMT)-like permease